MNPAPTRVQTSSGVAVVRGSELDPRQVEEVLSILLPQWGDTDPYLHDIARIMRNTAGDILVRLCDGRVDGVLRTKCIRANGDPGAVPATFEQLVGPYWTRRDPDWDTRILVDLTKRDGASGVARTLIQSAVDCFSEPNLATFSPEDAAGLHIHFGARAIRRIPYGRPQHTPPHVVVMCYRGFEVADRPASIDLGDAEPSSQPSPGL